MYVINGRFLVMRSVGVGSRGGGRMLEDRLVIIYAREIDRSCRLITFYRQ